MKTTQLAFIIDDPNNHGANLFSTAILLKSSFSSAVKVRNLKKFNVNFEFDSESNEQYLDWLNEICAGVIEALYSEFPSQVPTDRVQCLLFHLRDFDGIAHTCDSEIMRFSKEIHLSTRYISSVFDGILSRYVDDQNGFCVKQDVEDGTDSVGWTECMKKLLKEIDGVVWHESVHVWQNDGNGTLNGGLTEGIADFIRLEAGLSASDWNESEGGNWDDGYSKTAYFLKWINQNVLNKGIGTKINEPTPSPIPNKGNNSQNYSPTINFIQRLNSALINQNWSPIIFENILGSGNSISSLWKRYQSSLKVEFELVPVDENGWPIAEYCLNIVNPESSGSKLFMKYIATPGNISYLKSVSYGVLNILYEYSNLSPRTIHRVSLIVRDDIDGVAYTTETFYEKLPGSSPKHRAKEIHLSAKYILSFYNRLEKENLTDSQRDEIFLSEIHGVVWHEMTHVWQANGYSTVPGGLIEGIADYVRLEAGFRARHWSKEKGGDWDSGYEQTGFFLKWIENDWEIQKNSLKTQPGFPHFVQRLNASFIDQEWVEDSSFSLILGQSFDHKTLWKIYQSSLEENWKYETGPIDENGWPNPKIYVYIQDKHPGSEIFREHISKSEENNSEEHFGTRWLKKISQAVMFSLYSSTSSVPCHLHSIRFIVREDLDGVAYTTDVDLAIDPVHRIKTVGKEIHLSSGYIHKVAKQKNDWVNLTEEIDGVAWHEMVHVWQQSGISKKAPSGVIEGIADYVRLRSGLGAKHWKEEIGGNWDNGYSKTAYFFKWIEDDMRPETSSSSCFVQSLNSSLAVESWDVQLFEK
ncbi:hypothetical protein HK096_005541, partial [Nowakowskiella sp. JEL0078]